MQAMIEVTERVNASPAQVFELLADLGCHRRWISGVTYLSEKGKLRPGMRYDSVEVALGGEMAGRHVVRQVVEGELVEIDNVTGPLESTIQYSVEPSGHQAKVVCRFWIRSEHPVFGLALPLVEMLAKSRIEGDLKNLKIFAEAPESLNGA